MLRSVWYGMLLDTKTIDIPRIYLRWTNVLAALFRTKLIKKRVYQPAFALTGFLIKPKQERVEPACLSSQGGLDLCVHPPPLIPSIHLKVHTSLNILNLQVLLTSLAGIDHLVFPRILGRSSGREFGKHSTT